MRVVIYARISRDRTGEGASVSQQIDGLRDWVEREGWVEAHAPITEEGSASQYRKTDRARWGEVTDLVASGDIDAVLVWEQSRISRDGMDYEVFRLECIEHDVKLGVNGKLHDFTDADDDFMLGLGSSLSRRESAMISKRVRRYSKASAKAGLPHGRRQYGYKRIYNDAGRLVETVEDPDTGPIVREIFERFLGGDSMRSIAIDLNDRGVPTRTQHSSRWRVQAVRDILVNPGYAGHRVHQGRIVGPAAWPPLVTQDMFDEAGAKITHGTRPSRGPKVVHLLTGIAVCGICGTPVGPLSRKAPTVADPGKRLYQYACREQISTGGAGHAAMSEDYLDLVVSETMIARISQPDFLDQTDQADDEITVERRELREELAKYRAYLDDVARRAAEELNSELLFTQQQLIQPKIDAAEKALEQLSQLDPAVRRLASADDVRAAWEALGLEDKRKIISAVMTPRIMPMKPSERGRKGPNPDRVRIDWK